jgi:Mg2+ and Co2+ transporter CorA
VRRFPATDLPELLAQDEGIIWVDIPEPDNETARILSDVFGFHPLAIKDSLERNRVPKANGYADHVFFIMHKPERGERGHVHYIELDQFVGLRYLVTVHGPVNPKVDPSVAVRETQAVLARLEEGRLQPATPFELCYAIVSSLVRHHQDFLETVTADLWGWSNRSPAGGSARPRALSRSCSRPATGCSPYAPWPRWPKRSAAASARCHASPTTAADGSANGRGLRPGGQRRPTENTSTPKASSTSTRPSSRSAPRLPRNNRTRQPGRLTQASYTQNEELKKISAWAAILFAPTLVGTVYGMNFDHMPELHWLWGYPLALLLMGGTSLLLHKLFHHRRWL